MEWTGQRLDLGAESWQGCPGTSVLPARASVEPVVTVTYVKFSKLPYMDKLPNADLEAPKIRF